MQNHLLKYAQYSSTALEVFELCAYYKIEWLIDPSNGWFCVDSVPFYFLAVKQSNMCELSVEESCVLNDSTDANLDFMSTDTDESEPILEEEQNAVGNLIIKCSEVDYKKTRQDVENLAIELLAGRFGPLCFFEVFIV